MSEIELRECPFCGSAVVPKYGHPSPEIGALPYIAIRCTNCAARPSVGVVFETLGNPDDETNQQRIEARNKAYAAWNTRPRQSELEGIVREFIRITKLMPMSDLEFREQNIIAKLPGNDPHPIEQLVNHAVKAKDALTHARLPQLPGEG